jgi:hypothetical protein
MLRIIEMNQDTRAEKQEVKSFFILILGSWFSPLSLDVKPKVHNIAILHNIGFAFDA